uniref:Uncharacterized protein n=1 Tax=Molossus molossus TaxID=27622 RepID=A0A7J8JVH0_MOLMO|nr:hypothetical protein HJG59_007891 [Molossus molossus]
MFATMAVLWAGQSDLDGLPQESHSLAPAQAAAEEDWEPNPPDSERPGVERPRQEPAPQHPAGRFTGQTGKRNLRPCAPGRWLLWSQDRHRGQAAPAGAGRGPGRGGAVGMGSVEPKEEKRKGTLPREDAEKGDKRWLFIRRSQMGKRRDLWPRREDCVLVCKGVCGGAHSIRCSYCHTEQDNGTPWYKCKLVSVLGKKGE